MWRQPVKSKWEFFCEVDWEPFVEAIEAGEVRDHKLLQWYYATLDRCGEWNRKYRRESNWPQIGCGCKFVPYAKGPSKVLQIQLPNGSWAAVVSERLPSTR